MRRRSDGSLFCRAHGKSKPCPACASLSETQKRLWATPERRQKHTQSLSEREDTYFDDEAVIIRKLAGVESTAHILAEVNALRKRYLLKPRTLGSIHAWAEAHETSLMMAITVHSLDEVSTMFGVSNNTVRAWRDNGWLPSRMWGKFCVFDDRALLAFVKAYPWLMDAERIKYAPLRAAAEQANKRDGWIKARDMAPMVPMPIDMLLRMLHKDVVPHQQRTGHNAAFMIQRSAIRQIREVLAVEYGLDPRTLLTARQAGALMGVTWTTLHTWRRQRWLTPIRTRKAMLFDQDELVQLMLKRPWLVDTDRMPAGMVRAAAELAIGDHPYLTVLEFAGLVPTSHYTVMKYIHAHEINGYQRLGSKGRYMVRSSYVKKVRQLMKRDEKIRVEKMIQHRWANRHREEAA